MTKTKKQELFIDEKLELALVPKDEQPYEIPKNWIWVKLGNVVNIKRGASPRPIKAYITEEDNGVNWIKIGDTGEGKYVYCIKEKITSEGAKKSVYVERGTLLLSNSMSFGRPYILNIDGCIHDGWLAITVSDCFDKEYMYYALLSSDWYFEQVAVGTAVRNLNSKRVAGLPVILPPISEQQRIVDRIERLFTKLDDAKELAQKALDKFENYNASILHKAFTGELSGKWREKNGVGIDSWEDTTLKSHTSLLGDGLHGTPKYSDEGEFYFVNGNNFDGLSIVFKKNTKRVNTEEYEKYKKNLTDKTVFVSINGTLGKTAFYNNEPIILGKSACYFNVKDTLDKYFILYYLQTREFIKYAHEMATGSTIKNLSLKAMRNLPLRLPSLLEQQEIVKILANMLEQEQKANELCDVIDKIDLMKKTILARAFRGELGTNNPTEESAIELLKECLK